MKNLGNKVIMKELLAVKSGVQDELNHSDINLNR